MIWIVLGSHVNEELDGDKMMFVSSVSTCVNVRSESSIVQEDGDELNESGDDDKKDAVS